MVTAAHCLFQRRTGRYVRPGSVHFLLGYSAGGFAGHARAESFVIAPGYDPLREAETAGADWAVLTLDAALGTPGRVLALAAGSPAPGAGQAVWLGGYDQDRAEVIEVDAGCHLLGTVRDGEGRALLGHDCHATRGTSGAPLLRQEGAGQGANGRWQVVGIEIGASAGAAGGVAVPAASIVLPRN